MTLDKSITEAKNIGIWLHQHTNECEISVRRRERAGLSIFQQSLDINDAIIVLLENNLPGPALALARPLFESYVRGFWLLNCATEEEVDSFFVGKYPNFPGLMKAISNDAKSGGAWIHNNKDANLPSFHDLTHGGSEHIKRRLTLAAIEPNYPEQEQVSLLKLGIEIRIRIGFELLSKKKNEESMEKLNEKAKILRAMP
jgi:hypothetical protein